MTWDKVIVDVVGLALIAFIAWFFWLVKVKGVKAALTSSGYQEQMVLLPAFEKSAKLPEGETVPVEFLPKEPGEYEFACQMGMIRGKLVVE